MEILSRLTKTGTLEAPTPQLLRLRPKLLKTKRKRLGFKKVGETSILNLSSLSFLALRDCYLSKTRKILKILKVSLTSRKRLLITRLSMSLSKLMRKSVEVKAAEEEEAAEVAAVASLIQTMHNEHMK